ncbi:MAG: hypothetical protein ABIE55_04275 [Candidatus Aenigmatarchaeota archaeon]
MDKEIFEIGIPEQSGRGIPVNLVPDQKTNILGMRIESDPTLGMFVCSGPVAPPGKEKYADQNVELNFTGKPGEASGLYYALFFQLPKWAWYIQKADEWIEVSPTHKEYYDRTMATKQMLESTIKTGLSSAAQAVADFELMSHDLRKYKEILTYFAKKDEHSLKAMFIDQVDVHTDVSMVRTIAPRWPTIIDDFQSLTDDDLEAGAISKKYKISKAEAVILVTKNKLYKQWKNMFGASVRERYERIKGMVESRRKSIKEYKKWLKPYIARFSMTKLGGERRAVRDSTLKSFADITGVATFTNGIRIFAWRFFKTEETRKAAAEKKDGFALNPYDDYVRERFILDPFIGLASIYPWLNNDRKYCPKCKKYSPSGVILCPKCGSTNLLNKKFADEIVEEQILPAWKRGEMGLDPYEMYYIFTDYKIMRLGTRLPVGELEDITFNMSNFVVSQNILLVKILELKCRDIELEQYIDEILGVKVEERQISEIVMDEFPELFPKQEVSGYRKFINELSQSGKAYTSFLKKVKTPRSSRISFFKRGPYEHVFRERLSKHYAKQVAPYFFGIVKFIIEKMGVE